MAAQKKDDLKNAKNLRDLRDTFRAESPLVTGCLVAAFPIWFFSIFVFLPLASSFGQETRFLVSIIVCLVLAILMLRAGPGMKRMIDTAVIFPAGRFCERRRTPLAPTYTLFKHASYAVISAVLYLLSLPLLLSYHASIAGLVLATLFIWVGYMALRNLPIIGQIVLSRITEG